MQPVSWKMIKKTFKTKNHKIMKCWKFLPPSTTTLFIVDTCFYYQSKHNTLNTMHASTTTYFGHHQVKLHRHKWKSMYWDSVLHSLFCVWCNPIKSSFSYAWCAAEYLVPIHLNCAGFFVDILFQKPPKDRNLVVLDLNSEGSQLSKNNTIIKEYSYHLQC
jgi:hypothetical protein